MLWVVASKVLCRFYTRHRFFYHALLLEIQHRTVYNLRHKSWFRYMVNFPHIERVETISDGHDLDNEDYLSNDNYFNGNHRIEIKNSPYENIYKNLD